MSHPSFDATDHRNQHIALLKIGATLEGRDRGVGHSGKLQAEKIKTLKKEIVVVVLERNKLKQKKWIKQENSNKKEQNYINLNATALYLIREKF